MLTALQITVLQEALQNAKNPLFLYDADADGLCSFLLLYRIHKEGKGIRVSASSTIDSQFITKVQEISPDAIFVLDIPMMEQQFVDAVKVPIFWIDHHQPQQI
ncbi:MAG: hypothetical protein Q8R47_00485, partial [Nanoarchaeota archaeon]|nr:hypothetical protein [Nanoarchaeota archaeon]